MKKIIFLSILTALSFLVSACNQSKPIQSHLKEDKKAEVEVNNDNLNILTLFSSPLTGQNDLWVGTFQLVFNDMKNKVLKLDKIEFVGEKETPELVGLNKEEFKESMLNESSYYTSYGEVSPQAREKIRRGIKEKFNETSSLVDNSDWSAAPGKLYAYAMLKKVFKFLTPFDELKQAPFNESSELFSYFGIDNESNKKLYKNVKVLFYNSENDYGVQLLTKENDIVYLYRVDNPTYFSSSYKKMLAQTKNYKGDRTFQSVDTLKVPNLKIKEKRGYPELCDRQIKGSGFYFSSALETIELEFDKEGGKVKSEALLTSDNGIMIQQEPKKPRHFNFDKPFILFLVDEGKTDPYLAFYVTNLNSLLENKQ